MYGQFESLVNSSSGKTALEYIEEMYCLRALLIQVVIKLAKRIEECLICLRALLIQVVVKL